MSVDKTKKPKQPDEPKKRAAAKPKAAEKKPTKDEAVKKPSTKAQLKSDSKAALKSGTRASTKPAVKSEAKPKTESEQGAKAVEKKPAAKTMAEPKPAERKTAAKKSTKKADKVGSEASSKTPQVMRLVEQRNDMVNPTILAGKSSIPRKLRGLEPLTKIMKRDAETVFGSDEEAETFNLTALVIDDHAAQILRRFNACDCEVCIERLSQLTADSVPARFVKLKKRSVERKAAEVEELKAPLKRAVTSRMIRLVMQNKKRSFHDI